MYRLCYYAHADGRDMRQFELLCPVWSEGILLIVTSTISLQAAVGREDGTARPHPINPDEGQIKTGNPYSPSGAIALCTVIVLSHALAVLFTLEHRDAYGTQDEWLLQDLVLLCCSCAASITFCVSRGRWALVLVSLIIACYAIISYSNGAFIYQDLFLIASFGCLFGLLLPVHISRLLGGLIALLIVVVKWPKIFLGAVPPTDLALCIAVIIFYELFFITLASVMRELHTHLCQQREMNARLNNAVVRLTSANLGFQQHAFVMEEESAENERKRISRDIHDTVGYVMTNIIMMMEEADSLLGDGQARVRQLLRATQSQAQAGWNEARMALRALRTLPNDEDSCIKAIQRLVKVFRQATGIKIKLELGNIPMRFPEEIEAVVYRFVQEGLTNSFQHGRASAIDISFWMTERDLLVTLRDNGVGTSEFTEGIGLSGIRERLNPLGGTLAARNTVDGFELLIAIPYVTETILI